MKNAFDARSRAHDRLVIGNISLNYLQPWIADMLTDIGAGACNEIIKHAHRSAIGQQPIHQMAANEARSACDNVSRPCPQ